MRNLSIFPLLAISVLPALSSGLAAQAGTGDFNGDGYLDLAIGVPGETNDAGGVGMAGGVNVLYGSASGLSASGDQLWVQSGMALSNEDDDQFGWALAGGDFNGDGYADLAIGAPYEDLTGTDEGAVAVLYGSSLGLTATGRQFWTQNSSGVLDTAESDDLFGWSLAAGDFNLDGYHDLAIGAPGEDISTAADTGGVAILYGSASKLTATGDQFWTQGSLTYSANETGDQFGYALTAGDFGKSTHRDLAIGAPYEDWTSITDAGTVNVIYGSASGLTATGAQGFNQDTSGIGGGAEAGDTFGFSLAAANFGNSGQADLAIGVPHEAIGSATLAGAVNVIYGASLGLTTTGNQVWYQDVTGIQDTSEFFDHFGWSLAAANFGNSSHADLAIGIYGEDTAAGAVSVLYGGTSGLTDAGDQLWRQNTLNVNGTGGDNQAFGYALAAGNFGNSTHADLAIGSPWDAEPTTIFSSSGVVNVLYGGTSGLFTTGNQLWSQDSSGILGSSYYFESFGQALSGR
ncbi:MAG: hypothetical protein EYC70_07770 [Planctomycetota bacterium]|nr:MAG: hypothetical protein EYC70_07770 [Planctomycetota bacterium]